MRALSTLRCCVLLLAALSCSRSGFEQWGGDDRGSRADALALLTITGPSAPPRKEISFDLTLTDSGGRQFDLTPEFSDDGQRWLAATPAAGSAPLTAVEISPGGTSLAFIWDSMRDLGPFDVRGCELRFTARAEDGAELVARSGEFDVGNSVSVAASMTSSCASHPEGSVSCWGSDRYGQLGDGEASASPGPVQVSDLDDVWRVSVSAGPYNASACALARSGGVSCWGSNDRGQLGDGSLDDRDLPAPVLDLDHAVELTLGFEFACARRATGEIVCWGAGTGGQLGDGLRVDASLPVTVVGISGASKVTSSNYAGHACALVGDAIWCWGSNGAGQLGDGGQVSPDSPVQAAPAESWTDVAVGHNFTCGVRADQTVWCWGDNDNDQLGEDAGYESLVPVQIGGIDSALAVAAGGSNACAILTDRSLWCWGTNAYNNLLDDTLVGSGAPVELAELGAVAEVSMGGYTHGQPETSLCAVTMIGEVVCWGSNREGQHGDGQRSRQYQPTPIPAFAGATSITAGDSCTCAAVGGEVICAGSNMHGTLGDGSRLARAAPASVAGISTALTVAAATNWFRHGTHLCSLLEGGVISCWGLDSSGELGDQDPGGVHTTPVAALGISGATQMDVGSTNSCALLADQSVRCWGGNYYGELGDGSNQTSALPVEPVGLGAVSKIAAYYRHVCALLTDGALRCWGECDYGECGSGVRENFNTPQVVQGVSGALDIEVGGEHSCAILADRSVACWGADNAGQLGNGSLGGSSTPSPVEGLSGASALALGFSHSCALLLDGSVWCWGEGRSGQLGPDQGIATSPIQVEGVSDAVAVYAGGSVTFVVDGAGEVRGFGDKQFGQLATGEAWLRPSPVPGLP